MKRILFTLLFFCTAAGLLSCRKSGTDISIKQFDEQEIQNYISANGLSSVMQRATDTTGIYYQILTKGTGATVDYPSLISLVFTMKSFDGTYNQLDTINNHVYNYLGHITQNSLPVGVQLAILNIMKTKGTRARVLIPSRLAYGVNGSGTGSSEGTNRIKGNQCLDLYINIVNNTLVPDPQSTVLVNSQSDYDDLSVTKYIAANNLTGFQKAPIFTSVTNPRTNSPGVWSGLWYKITQAGSGATITPNSVVDLQYTGILFDGVLTADQVNNDSGTGLGVDLTTDSRLGMVEAMLLPGVSPGAKLTIIVPSRLAYGSAAPYSTSTPGPDGITPGYIPPNSCMRYDINVISIE